MFSRLVKETLDLMTTLSKDTGSPQQPATGNEAIVPTLSIAHEESQSIQSSVLSILEKSWAWLAGVLDVVEGQLRMGKHFDTKVRSWSIKVSTLTTDCHALSSTVLHCWISYHLTYVIEILENMLIMSIDGNHANYTKLTFRRY